MLQLPAPDPSWAPAFYTKPIGNLTRGEDVAEFAGIHLTAPRGFREGKPLEFTSWQTWLTNGLYELNPLTGFLRYRRAVVGLPRKNGKSVKGSAFGLHGLRYGPLGAQIYSAASDKEQAKIVFSEAKRAVEQSPALSRIMRVYRDAIELPQRDSVYRALSADAFRNQGLGPYIVIGDELHAWPSTTINKRGDELYAALTEGSGDRPESLFIGITTAGSDPETLLGRLYEYGKRVAEGEVEDPSFGFFWWEAAADADPTSPLTWRIANPNLAEGLLAEDDFRSALASAAGASGFAAFQRYRLNQWVRTAGEDFISPFHWKNIQADGAEVPKGARVTVGFDGSVNTDATALVIQDLETGLLERRGLWEPDPNNPDWFVDPEEVDAAVAKVFEEYDVVLFWFDPAYFRDQGGQWAKTYRGRVEQIPQSNERIAPLAQQFLKDVVSKDISHNGDPAMRRHVLNAVATEAGSYKKEKPKSPRKIDLLAASVMANGARHRILNRPERKSRRAAVL